MYRNRLGCLSGTGLIAVLSMNCQNVTVDHNTTAFHAGAFGTECQPCHSTAAWTPAQFNLSHPWIDGDPPLQYHRATCRTCHPSTVNDFTCHDSNHL